MLVIVVVRFVMSVVVICVDDGWLRWFCVVVVVLLAVVVVVISVVELFHFGPAPALAGQDGDTGSSSSSSPVVHNLLLKNKFHFSIYRGLFYSQIGTSGCFALPALHLKGHINFILHY